MKRERGTVNLGLAQMLDSTLRVGAIVITTESFSRSSVRR